MNNFNLLKISIGGKVIEVDSVLLHSAASVAKWQGLIAKAQPLLAGFSTGVGIWGSPGVALTGAVALGLLETAVSNANQKAGFQLLSEAFALASRLRPRGVFIPVSEIGGVDLPHVEHWRARGVVESELDVRSMNAFEKQKIRSDHGATEAEIASGFIVRQTMQDLVFFSDEFVTCNANGKRILVKWSSIDFYEAG